MSEPRSTLVCFFDPAGPHLAAFDIHEWNHSQFRVSEYSVSMIQIDGIHRQVYIKLIDLAFVHDILRATNGETIYKHVTGEISPVRLMVAGMGLKRVRLANLPHKSLIAIFVLLCRNVGMFKKTGGNVGEALPLQSV